MSQSLFEEMTVTLDSLLLDPNNPRFVQRVIADPLVPDDKIEEAQESITRRFATDRPDEAEGDELEQVFSIKDLVDSMRTVGFVTIDRVVVRRLAGGKFIVVDVGDQ